MNIPVHEIHVSEIKDFKKCRTAHHFKFDEQYYPFKVAKPLEFGTAYHAAKETYFNPDTWQYPEDIRGHLAKLRFIEVCDEQRKVALERFGVTYLDQDQNVDYNERLELGIGMLEYYFTVISPEKDTWFEPVYVEKSFSVPVLNPDNGVVLRCKCDKCIVKWKKFLDSTAVTVDYHGSEWLGNPVHLEGKIDAIVRDKRTNRYWVVDWKTTARIADNHEWLEMDEQPLFYCVAIQLLLGVDVAGFLYHEQRKGYPLPPKQLDRPRLGRSFSVAKDQDTDYDTFLKTVQSEDAYAYGIGLYDEFLEFLENEGIKYFERTEIRKNNAQLRLAQSDLYSVVSQIIAEDRVIYPTPSKYNCGYCAFQQVCVGRATLGDWQYTLNTMFEQREHYYEERTTD